MAGWRVGEITVCAKVLRCLKLVKEQLGGWWGVRGGGGGGGIAKGRGGAWGATKVRKRALGGNKWREGRGWRIERGEILRFGSLLLSWWQMLEGCCYLGSESGAALPTVCLASPSSSLYPDVDTGPFPWREGSPGLLLYGMEPSAASGCGALPWDVSG